MLVLEVHGAPVPLGQELGGIEEALADAVRVEAQLGARERVDEGSDELEERVHEEGDVHYERASKALGIWAGRVNI